MKQLLLLLPPLLPLLLALLIHRFESRWWLFAAAAPGLLAALLLDPGSSVTLPWLLLGTHLQLDTTAQLFLLFGALIWMLASLCIPRQAMRVGSSDYRKQSFLLAMGGNALLILAADMLTFYVGFALMGLSAYGLVRGPSQRTRGAARLYLVFTLAGELALFAALLFILASAESLLFADLSGQSLPGVAIALLLLGFGIKLAIPGLHLWLPGAYTWAPVFGVAVLSGPMMKAGLLGWLRFLPFGTTTDPIWGELLMTFGLAGVLLGLLAGLLQRLPEGVLAYSSVAKMGLISVLVGFSLNHPALAPELLPLIVLLALHHLMVKPMLFMGLLLPRTPWFSAAVLLLALSLAALPMTGGGAVKHLLSSALNQPLNGVLLLSGIAGVALMGRFVWLMHGRHASSETGTLFRQGWLLITPVALWAPFAWEGMVLELKSLWPFLIGSLLFSLTLYWQRYLDLRGREPGRVLFRLRRLRGRDHLPIPTLAQAVGGEMLRHKAGLLPGVLLSRMLDPAMDHIALWWLLLMLLLLGGLGLSVFHLGA